MLLLGLQTVVALIAPADWILMEIAVIIVLIIVNIEPLIGFLFTMLDGMKKKKA